MGFSTNSALPEDCLNWFSHPTGEE